MFRWHWPKRNPNVRQEMECELRDLKISVHILEGVVRVLALRQDFEQDEIDFLLKPKPKSGTIFPGNPVP